jgi:hypothetical protein
METDPDFNNEENPPPKKPSGLELVLIIILFVFSVSGIYKFGIWLIKYVRKIPQKIEQYP